MLELRVICARLPLNALVSAECLHLAGSPPDSEGVADGCASLEALAVRVGQLGLRAERFKIQLLHTSPVHLFSEPEAARAGRVRPRPQDTIKTGALPAVSVDGWIITAPRNACAC
jgi:hypothetical protein